MAEINSAIGKDDGLDKNANPFDGGVLFAAYRNSVIRITDRVSLGPNVLENTLGSGFAIEKINPEQSPEISHCRFATDNHVVAQVSKDAKVQLLNGKEYGFSVEQLDETNDLAILDVTGIESGDCRPLNLIDRPKPLSASDPILKIGARNGYPEFTAGFVETYFQRDEARGLPLLPGEDKARPMLSIITGVADTQSGDSGGPIIDREGTVVAVMDAEGPNVIAGTPAHLLLQDLRHLQATALEFPRLSKE